MKPVMKVCSAELAEAVASDSTGPAVIDGNDLMQLIALGDRASMLANNVADPNSAEAIRLLSLALGQAGSLLADIISALHHGSVGVTNYPEALEAFPGTHWRVETQAGRINKVEKGLLDPRHFLDKERVAFLTSTQPGIFEQFEVK